MSDKIREAFKVAADAAGIKDGTDRLALWAWWLKAWKAALAQQPATTVPDGWRDVIENARESIGAGALQENANNERRYVEPYLDGIYDELEALEQDAAPVTPTQADHAALLNELYHILGEHGATEDVLDQIQAAIDGKSLPHASLLPYEAPAAQEPVAWLRDDGDGDLEFSADGHGFPVYTTPPVAEQPYSTTSDKYRAELYDEVWEKARSMGCGNVTMALAELERHQASEQPDTVKAPRELLSELRAFTLEYDSGRAGVMRGQIDALLGKEGA